MGQAAVPSYLGDDFSSAPPGHRFGLYLPLWLADSWSREPDKPPGKDGTLATGKSATLTRVVDLKKFKAMNDALSVRQAALSMRLSANGSLLALHAESSAPFTTGLGNEHPLENGFAFLNPYGLPYLPGSGVKGVLRKAASELEKGDWGHTAGWTTDAIDCLFGRTSADGETESQRGALMFWDVLPQIEGDALIVEVMTPHQSHYYAKKKETPHESGQPNPIHFLTVPPGSKFTFHVQCDVLFLARLSPELRESWQEMLRAAFQHAFEWLGFGAKTAVGYGAMRTDKKAAELAVRQLADMARAKTLTDMTAAGRAVEAFVAEMTKRKAGLRGNTKEKPHAESHNRATQLAKLALTSPDWSADEKRQAADAIEQWLPDIVNLPDKKDAFKKLKLRDLRGLG